MCATKVRDMQSAVHHNPMHHEHAITDQANTDEMVPALQDLQARLTAINSATSIASNVQRLC